MTKKDVWFMNDDDKWEFLEHLYSIPVEQRLEWFLKEMEKRKKKSLGTTDKTAPELAIELLKKGIRAKSL